MRFRIANIELRSPQEVLDMCNAFLAEIEAEIRADERSKNAKEWVGRVEEQVSRRLNFILEGAPVVYGYIGQHGSSWGSHPPGTFIQETLTHAAQLVNVREIEREK